MNFIGNMCTALNTFFQISLLLSMELPLFQTARLPQIQTTCNSTFHCVYHQHPAAYISPFLCVCSSQTSVFSKFPGELVKTLAPRSPSHSFWPGRSGTARAFVLAANSQVMTMMLLGQRSYLETHCFYKRDHCNIKFCLCQLAVFAYCSPRLTLSLVLHGTVHNIPTIPIEILGEDFISTHSETISWMPSVH